MAETMWAVVVEDEAPLKLADVGLRLDGWRRLCRIRGRRPRLAV